MRRVVAVPVVLLTFLIGCGKDATNPVAPSGSEPTERVLLQFNPAVHREPNKFSLTVKGATSSDDLINALPLAEPLKSNESWSGAVMRLLEWTTSTAITTNVPFTPPSRDHFQFDDVPSTGAVDISLELIPGGQPVGGPFHNIRLKLNRDDVQLPSGFRFEDRDGRVHIVGPLPK